MLKILSNQLGTFMTVEMLNSVPVTWVLIISLTFYLLCHQLRQPLRTLRLMFSLPGPPGLPIFGSGIRTWILNPEGFNESRRTFRKLYGPVIKIWNFIFPIVMITDPKDVEKVLGSSKHLEKPFYYSFVKNLLGEGLVTSQVSTWRNYRRIILPYFHIKNIEKHIQVFNKGSRLLNKAFEQRLEKTSNINITSLINDAIFAILNETVLGLDFDDAITFKDINSSPFKMSSIKIMERFFKPWLGLNFIYQKTNPARKENDIGNSRKSFTEKIIKERKEMREKGVHENQCLLDFLLDISNENFTEEDCINEAGTFMLAGQDSVASTIAFCLHQIANNSEVQKKIVRELDLIFEDSERCPTASDVRKMTYIEQCIKETMRLYPAVPAIVRKLGEDVKIGNHVIPKGCTILISPWLTNALDEYYPDPEIFNPDRFEPSRCEERHQHAFLSFSAGPRNCIGYKFALIEMKTIISSILRKYWLAPVPGKEKQNVMCKVILRATGGVWIKLTSKKKKTEEMEVVLENLQEKHEV